MDYDAYRMAAGASRNGIIRIFDLRYNKNSYDIHQELKNGTRGNDGWSLYLGNNRSPVYSLQVNHISDYFVKFFRVIQRLLTISNSYY